MQGRGPWGRLKKRDGRNGVQRVIARIKSLRQTFGRAQNGEGEEKKNAGTIAKSEGGRLDVGG